MNDVGKNMFPTMTYDKFSTQQLQLPLKQSAQDICTLISPSLLVHEGYGHLQHPRHRLAAPAAQAHDALGPGAVGDMNLKQTVNNHSCNHHLHINVIYLC